MERWLVRLAGVATFVAGAVVDARATPPRPLPGWALSSHFVFGLAVAVAVIGPLCLLLTLAVQTIVRGRVPTAIARDGLTWSEEASTNGGAALGDLQLEIDRLAADLANLATGVVADEQAQAVGSDR
jgi:hypothetical protein